MGSFFIGVLVVVVVMFCMVFFMGVVLVFVLV